ncbi:MAG: hypothetical protein IKR40_08115 [Treponema sp.]|nr:hypothetical protein [Treponema sp.]
MKQKLIISILLCSICTSLFAKSYEHYTWSREIPNTDVTLYLEVFCPYDENIYENATKKMDELQVSWENSTEYGVWSTYTYIGSLTDFQYLVQKNDYIVPTEKGIADVYSKIEIFDRNYENIHSEYSHDCLIGDDEYDSLVYEYLLKVYPPNFKVGDYINELDATVFKIDGNNVTLYHYEDRNVTYSALETFCKNFQKDGYSGWRLPTIDEMNYMYTYRINSGTYWASTAKPEEHWAMDLVSGKWYKDYYTKLNVFVVKSLDVATINDYFPPPIKEPEKKIDEGLRHNFKIGDYLPEEGGKVFKIDGNCAYVFHWEGQNITFTAAKTFAKNYIGGGDSSWRLPTKDELDFIFANRRIWAENFWHYPFWSSSLGKDGNPLYINFDNGNWYSGKESTTCKILVVRSFFF